METSRAKKFPYWLTGHRKKEEQKVETKLRGVVSVMSERHGDRCLQGKESGAEGHVGTEAENFWGGERGVWVGS